MNLHATPTSLFWTNCITDVEPTGKGNIDVDNYFTVFNRRGHGQSFFPDVGIVIGIFSWADLHAEAGIDYLGGADDPLFFNAKVGMEENKLFRHAPAFSLGVFNIGTRTEGPNKTNQNIFDYIFGKTLPDWIGGRLFVGGFLGNEAMGKDQQGFMIGYLRSFCPAKDCRGRDYYKWEFAADYASGKNTIGGGGFALIYYFTPTISLESGPVWFNSAEINGTWKWSVQLDINVTIFKKNIFGLKSCY